MTENISANATSWHWCRRMVQKDAYGKVNHLSKDATITFFLYLSGFL